MTLYEQRLARDKDEIRRRVSEVGVRVGQAVQVAVDALLAHDEAACSRVVLGDLPINREIRAIDKLCHAFVARHLPSAGHLRFVSSVFQMNVALERIGDYAATIAREGVQISSPPPAPIADQMRHLAKDSCSVLAKAMAAFSARDEELARRTKPATKGLEAIYAKAFDDLVAQGNVMPTVDLFALLTVFHRLGRVSDQAKNLCEDTLFELTGETKPPKRYRILFVDARGTLVSPLAVALARRAFPESGEYGAVGFNAGSALAPELERIAGSLGLDLGGLAPRTLDSNLETLSAYHVIVCLSSEARRAIPKVPYNSAILVWELPPWSEGPAEELQQRLSDLGRFLSSEIHGLIVTLRGEQAS